MNILLVAATEPEVMPFIEKCRVNSTRGSRLKCCSYKKHNVDILISGAGIAATSFQLGRFLNDSYDVAINAGIAGSFRKDIELGVVVNVIEDCFSELGAENGDEFISIDDLGFGKARIPVNKAFKNPVVNALPKHYGITVNTVHGNENSILTVTRRYAPEIESMEGAAFIIACNELGVFCVQLRAVSNYVERRNRDAWNIPLAIGNLNKKLEELFDSL